MLVEEKDTQKSSAVPQKEFVSFMVHGMAAKQRDRFNAFCAEKGFNYGPGITYLLDHFEDFHKKKGEEKL